MLSCSRTVQLAYLPLPSLPFFFSYPLFPLSPRFHCPGLTHLIDSYRSQYALSAARGKSHILRLLCSPFSPPSSRFPILFQSSESPNPHSMSHPYFTPTPCLYTPLFFSKLSLFPLEANRWAWGLRKWLRRMKRQENAMKGKKKQSLHIVFV